jgi:hypothetical protein
MFINFCISGRLGNAIFRYMASVIMCIYYNGTYTINNKQNYDCRDEQFIKIIKKIINKKQTPIKNPKLALNKVGVNLTCFYQHDLIYKLHKQQILDFIRLHSDHYVLTDGVNAGDKNYEKFFMIDIINTPPSFDKRYKNILHVRLEDFVKYNLFLKVERILYLLDKNIIKENESLCIVCKKPSTDFENKYIKQITDYLSNKKIAFFLEHNDTITDYYIMKEAELLICSKSTLSWCAAFFSDKIKYCYLPDYVESQNSTCKYPIDNTELY